MNKIENIFSHCTFEFSNYLLHSKFPNLNYRSNIELSSLLLIDCYIVNKNLFLFDLVSNIIELDDSDGFNHYKFLSESKKLIYDNRIQLESRFLFFLLNANHEDVWDRFIIYLKKDLCDDSLLSCYRFSSYLLEVIDVKNVLGIGNEIVISISRTIINIIRERFKSALHLDHSAFSKAEDRVVLLIEHIPFNPKTGAHLSQINNIIEGLLYKKVHVLLLITNEKIRFDFIPWRKHAEGLVDFIKNYHNNPEYLNVTSNNSFDVITAKSNISLINEFRPKLIMKFGGALESKVFDKVFLDKIPFIYSQFNAHNIPDLNYDLFLSNGKLLQEREKWFERPIPLDYKIIDSKEYSSNLNLVTVLGGKRLYDLFVSYTEDDINKFIEIINIIDKWTFVGNIELVDYFKSNKNTRCFIESGKIQIVSLAPNLFEFYGDFDIFVMPPKSTGGAGGAAIAAGAGLVTLSSFDADIANLLPEKYLINDFFCLHEIIKKYSLDPSLLTISCKEIQIELLKRKPKLIVDKLLCLFNHAYENFSHRPLVK